jgi:hypothetical protein
MSFHESSRSSAGFPRDGAAESGLGASATLASGWRQGGEGSKPDSMPARDPRQSRALGHARRLRPYYIDILRRPVVSHWAMRYGELAKNPPVTPKRPPYPLRAKP